MDFLCIRRFHEMVSGPPSEVRESFLVFIVVRKGTLTSIRVECRVELRLGKSQRILHVFLGVERARGD